MPSVNEVIERVGRLKPNAIEDEDKARWLMELDGRTYQDLTKGEAPEKTPPQTWPEDGDKELLAPPPYDNMYDLYLTAMIEFYMREYNNYNNTVGLFNQAMEEFRARWRQDHPPRAKNYRNVMG